MASSLWKLTTRYSILQQTIKSVVWLLRMKSYFQNQDKIYVPIPYNSTSVDNKYNSALLTLIRLTQQQAFQGLVEALEVSS